MTLNATFFGRDRGRFQQCAAAKHIWQRRESPGLALDVRWFWDSNRPSSFEVSRQLLGK